MTTEASQLLPTLLRLDPKDRAELVAELLDSIEADTSTEADAEVDAEITRRIEEVASGHVKPVPWSEARSCILADDDDGNR